jgi:DNA polymerase-3 subunit delta'
MVFPWQKEQWHQLWQALLNNRLPHALLFTGIAGTGKAEFAGHFTRLLLCQNRLPTDTDVFNATAQCTCHACRLISGRTHPNVLWIEPDKEGQAIKVDQIREVSEFINQTSLQGEYRIVIINPADRMNTNASNALLKTLEEPSSGAVLILITDQASHLPATILSRCQHIMFPRPQATLAIEWLKNQLPDSSMDAELILNLSNGAPLAALEFVTKEIPIVRHDLFQALYGLSKHETDPIQLAAQLQDIDSLRLLDFMLTWITDLLRLQSGSEKNTIINRDFAPQLAEIGQRSQISNNLRFMDYLLQLRGQICSGINFNKTLMIENLLIRWMECV